MESGNRLKSFCEVAKGLRRPAKTNAHDGPIHLEEGHMDDQFHMDEMIMDATGDWPSSVDGSEEG
jgi:hypothetical protein